MGIIRCKFRKENDMKYISHLDLMRLFEKMLRIAKIRIGFTQGFNPHPKIAFGQALSLGIESMGEYVDIELKDDLTDVEFLKRINEVAPDGILFTKGEYISNTVDALMSSITHGSYLISIKLKEDSTLENINEKINEFLKLEEIIDLKENKKGNINEVNIRPMITQITVVSYEDKNLIINTTLATGSAGNLKPSVLINKLESYLDFKKDSAKIIRKDLFIKKNESLLTPI